MAKGTTRVLLTLALMAIICCAEEWECEKDNPYELYGTDGDSKYYVCLSKNSDKLYFDCPEGLTFKKETKSCTLELEQVTTPTCSSKGEKFVYIEEESIGGGEDDDDDDDDDTDLDSIASKISCNSYWLCSDQLKAEKKDCDGDKLFNTLILDCVDEKYWTCDEGSPDCEAEGNPGKKWPNKKDCGTFYECIGTIPTKRKCSEGYYFSAVGQGCVHNVDEQCKVPTAWVPAPLVDLENMCKGNVGKFLPDPNYCKAYYYCVSEDIPYWSPCDNDRYFDNGKCVANAPNTCKCETVDWEKEKVDKINIPSSDPKKYYYCVKGKVGVEITCPKDMEFDEEERMCAE